MTDNFEVLTDEVLQVRDLEPEDLYIYKRVVEKNEDTPRIFWKYIRIREEDPFFAKTIFQTSLHEYPSERVYRVRRLDDEG